jgi:hypothetical protein
LLRGTLNADVPEVIPKLFGIADDRHVMAVLPIGKKTVAMIVLFGGQSGSAVIDLGVDSRRLFNNALRKNEHFDCVFSIPLTVRGSRPLESRSIQQIAAIGALNDLLPESRAAAELEEQARRGKIRGI